MYAMWFIFYQVPEVWQEAAGAAGGEGGGEGGAGDEEAPSGPIKEENYTMLSSSNVEKI